MDELVKEVIIYFDDWFEIVWKFKVLKNKSKKFKLFLILSHKPVIFYI